MRILSLMTLGALSLPGIVLGAEPTQEEVKAALIKAVRFMDEKVGSHGGHVWRASGDVKLREGEGKAPPSVAWVQPPGTPSIGEAFLDAYLATKDPSCLDAAKRTGMALVKGQLQSGGWTYSIRFDPEDRKIITYRIDLSEDLAEKLMAKGAVSEQGWDVWRFRKGRHNITTLDDDTTQAALRFLMRLDQALDLKDKAIHEATLYGLRSVLQAQYPNGGWSANWDRFPTKSPSAGHFPVQRAEYPDEWPRQWPKTFTGCYVLNDNLQSDMIDTLLLAHRIYKEDKYLDAAKKAGDFLLLAQMPDPQPGWAQQYDKHMHPDWSRAFEPPAISGSESQTIMTGLMNLVEATGDKKYLEPIPKALAYFRKSLLSDGRLARFYEMKTNRPLYFVRDDKGYHLTYKDDKLPTHYGFKIGSKLDRLQKRHDRLSKADLPSTKSDKPKMSEGLRRQVAAVIGQMDARGAWIDQDGRMRAYKVQPESGVIESATFIKNVEILCRYLRAS